MQAEQPAAPEKSGKKTLLLVLGGLAGCGCLVIVVIVAFGSVLAPAVMQQVEQARVQMASAQLRAAEMRIETHARQNGGALPASLEEVDWGEAGHPVDPWGMPFVYERAGDGASFTLTCLGADGARGGEGADADLVVPQPPADAGD